MLICNNQVTLLALSTNISAYRLDENEKKASIDTIKSILRILIIK